MPDKYQKLFLLLSLFFFTNVNAQFEKVEGFWKNADSVSVVIFINYIHSYIISNPTTEFNSWDNNRRFASWILGDTLRFGNDIGRIVEGPPKDTTYFGNYHDFKIITCTDSTLILVPISQLSKEFFKNRDTLKLVRKDHQLYKSVTFEKIVCNYRFPINEENEDGIPSFYLEIDNKRNIYIDGTFYKDIGSWTTLQGWSYPAEYVVDKSLTGKFRGVLTDSIYDEIMHLLKLNAKYSFLEEISTDSINSSTFHGIVYSNNQQKFIRGFYNNGLSEYYLSTINKRLKLSRVIEEKELKK